MIVLTSLLSFMKTKKYFLYFFKERADNLAWQKISKMPATFTDSRGNVKDKADFSYSVFKHFLNLY